MGDCVSYQQRVETETIEMNDALVVRKLFAEAVRRGNDHRLTKQVFFRFFAVHEAVF